MTTKISTIPVRVPIAYGYLRYSTIHQELSPEIQREQVESAFRYRFEPKGYRWGGIFEDPATMGKTHFRERPAGHELYQRLQTGDAIIIQRPDRLCRRHSDSVRIVEDFINRNIILYATQWSLDTANKSYGKMVFGIMGSLSEWENDVRAERVKEAMQHLKTKGLPTGWHPGYGYKWEGYKRVPCERDLKIMHDIVDWVSRGWGFSIIADHLNRHGFFARKWKREHGRKGGMWRFTWIPWKSGSVERYYKAELQRRANLADGQNVLVANVATMTYEQRMHAQACGVSGAETRRHESEVLRDQTVDASGRRAPDGHGQEQAGTGGT